MGRKDVWEFITRPARKTREREQVFHEQARETLEWTNQKAHRRFVDQYLRPNAEKPIPLDKEFSHHAIRTNTFREILLYVLELERRAKGLTGDE